MPRLSTIDHSETNRFADTLKTDLEALGLQVRLPYRTGRGTGKAVNVGQLIGFRTLYVSVDIRGRCRISVPTETVRRYITTWSFASTIRRFISQYGQTWANENRDRQREHTQREQQATIMKATLERVFSRAGLIMNERRCTVYPQRGSFVCRGVSFQGLTLGLEGKIEQAVPLFTHVNIHGGTTNVKVNKLTRALSMLTGQQACPV